MVAPDYNAGHPTSASIAKDVNYQQPELMLEVAEGTSRPVVNHHEAEFFRRHGYLIKRGLLSNRNQLNQAVEYMWSKVPNNAFERGNTDTWLDSPSSKWSEDVHEIVGLLHGTNWKMRSRGPDGIGTEHFLVNEIANHPLMISVAESFLGGRIKPVNRVRGIYAILPTAKPESDTLHPHGDYMAAQLSAMVLVDDVGPRGGGFTVWPGSHHRLHMQWDLVQGSVISGSRVEGFREERDKILRDTAPVELAGRAGDVVFWHPRMLHSAGVNYTAGTSEPKIRVIVPCDYQLAGRTLVDDLEFGPGPVYQWWVDTRNIMEDIPSTPNNMWDGWAI